VCLFPTGGNSPEGVQLCLVCGDRGTADLIGNVLLFIPVGFAAFLVTRSAGRALLVGALLSLGVEAAQLWIPGRYTTVSDLVANSSGALLGALLGATREGWWRPNRELALKLSYAWAGFATVLILTSGFLLSPSVPRGELYAGWTPELEGFSTYGGRILAAQLGGIPLPDRRLDDQAWVRAALERGVEPLVVRFQAGPEPARPAVLFRIVDGNRREGLRIGVDRSNLWIAPRYRADDLRLSRPVFTLSRALAGEAAGNRAELTLSRALSASSEVSLDGNPLASLELTAGRGWSLLFFSRRFPYGWLGALDLLWLGLLFAPLGWWAPSRRSLWLAGIPVALLIAAPWWSTLASSPPSELAAVAVAALTGQILHSTRERGRFH